MATREHASAALRRGHFREAYELHSYRPHGSEASAVDHAEILFFLGNVIEGTRSAASLLKSKTLSPNLISRCTSLLAEERWLSGDPAASIGLYQRALKHAELSSEVPLICIAALRLLERSCDETGFDASAPLAQYSRRFAARAADCHIHAQVHLTFARLEAKLGNLPLAHKHFELARKMLAVEPNFYLEASADIDESVARWINGEITAAIELALKGSAVATQIGWSKGKIASSANLACLYVCLNRLEEAHRQIDLATREPFVSQSFKLALADTRARALIRDGAYEEAKRVLDEYIHDKSSRPWYGVTAEQTYVQLLLKQGAVADALNKLDTSIASARQARLVPLVTALELLRVEAIAQTDSSFTDVALPRMNLAEAPPIGLVGLACSAVGTALLRSDRTDRGKAFLSRARRGTQRNWRWPRPVACRGESSEGRGKLFRWRNQ